jgi:radical SAM protein with 4Fe4S-binding SPASM domain
MEKSGHFMNNPYVFKASLPEHPLWEKTSLKRIPFSFELELTARCNNNCRHCYINLPAGNREVMKKELSLKKIMQLADQAVELGSLWCLISGGEPLLRPDFPEIYLGLKQKGMLVSVFTNGCLISENVGELFQEYPPRAIEITVYGINEETYERITQTPGSYRAFRRGLDVLQSKNIKVRLKAIVISSNVHELSAIADFCRKNTSDYFRLDPLLNLRHDNNPEGNEKIKAERLTPEAIAAVDRLDEERFRALKKECEKFNPPSSKPEGVQPFFNCGAGRNSFSISYDGFFRLCSSLSSPDFQYDLKKGSLREAWFEFAPPILTMTPQDPDYLNSCAACSISNLCPACPAQAYLETGRLDGCPKYLCEVTKGRIKMIEG